MAQIDVLDNIVMGSTPDSSGGQILAPAPALYTTQIPPETGINSTFTSVRAKRAWGEVDSEFGSLRFGRMPWHFGRGIAFNNGSCPDCEGGTTVDRIIGITQLYGHQFALSWDFGSQGHYGGYTPPSTQSAGFPLDLSQRDDVLQLMGSISKLDDDVRFNERAAQGELMFNYALQVVYREQGQERYDLSDDAKRRLMMTGMLQESDLRPPNLTDDVDALVVMPSLWMKLGWKAFERRGGGLGDRGPHRQRRTAGGRAATGQQAPDAAAAGLGRGHRAAPVPQRLFPGIRDRWRDR
jgi:uncharacterized protein (TIGR04551 family)